MPRLIKMVALFLVGLGRQILEIVQCVKPTDLWVRTLVSNRNDVINLHTLWACRVERYDGIAVCPLGCDLFKKRTSCIPTRFISLAVFVIEIHLIAAWAKVVCRSIARLARFSALHTRQRTELLSVVNHRIAVTPHADTMGSAHAFSVHRITTSFDRTGSSRSKLPFVGVATKLAMPFHAAFRSAVLLSWRTRGSATDDARFCLSPMGRNASQLSLVMQSTKAFGVAFRLALPHRTQDGVGKNDVGNRLDVMRTTQAFRPEIDSFTTFCRTFSGLFFHPLILLERSIFTGVFGGLANSDHTFHTVYFT